ncbi:MAG: protein TolQ [Deltaproteobacteria bacterium]|nr:protein TolQ [Deltaproteobacteria bacterium]
MVESTWPVLLLIPSEIRTDVVSLVTGSGTVVFGVLMLLIFFSVACWAIIAFKFTQVRRAHKESAQFLEMFWQSRKLDTIYEQSERLRNSPVSEVFRAGYIELSKLRKRKGAAQGGNQADSMLFEESGLENVERAMRRAASAERTRLERFVPFLATTGSSAPFIGLFGTVWGIMDAFHKIGTQGGASLPVVAPGISEALIATATGLAAAIPAVIGYNYYVAKLKELDSEVENFANDFLNIVKRVFFR